MTPMINTDDLCDAAEVAELLGLRHPNSVHTYLRRYADMPRPAIDLGPGRPRLWLRPQIEVWLGARSGSRLGVSAVSRSGSSLPSRSAAVEATAYAARLPARRTPGSKAGATR